VFCFQVVDGEEGRRVSLSDTVLPSTPESPGEMFVSPLGSAGSGSTRRGSGKASRRLSGISSLVKSPKQRQRQSADLSGLKSLMKTPKTLKSPDLSGVKHLLKTPKAQKSPGGVKKQAGTLKDVTDTPALDGIRKLVKTPKPRKSPVLAGIKQLVKTPKAQKSPSLEGVKKLVTTPKDTAGSPNLSSVRKLVKTPKPRKSPALAGIKKLMKTPKAQKSPSLEGVKKLVKTPKVQKSPSLAGIRKMLKTPKPKKSPQLAGLKTLMKTPRQQQSPALAGVRQLMKTPKSGPKSPDFVGVSEMLTSPQAAGSVFVDMSRQKSARKKKASKKISSPVSQALSPKIRDTQGRKMPLISAQRQMEVDKTLLGSKRGTSSRKLSDEDHVVVSKKRKLSKPDMDVEVAKADADGRNVDEINSALSPTLPRGRSRSRRQKAEEVDGLASKTKKSKASSSTPVAKMSKTSISEAAVDVSSSPKAAVKSSAKGSKMPKKAVEGNVSFTAVSVDQAVVTGRKAGKTSVVAAKKSTRNVKIITPTPISSLTGLRRAGRGSKAAKKVAGEISLAADDTDGRVKTKVAGDSEKEAQQVGGKKSRRAARNENKAVVIDLAQSEDDAEVDVTAGSTGRRSAKKTASRVNTEKSKAKTNVKTTKGKESQVDSSVDKPVAGRRGKSVKQTDSVPSKKQADGQGSAGSAISPVSTRRGKRQVTINIESRPAVENVKIQHKKQESPAVATVARGRQRKPKVVDEEPQKAVLGNKTKMPSRRQKNQDTAKVTEPSTEDATAIKPVVVRKGKQTASLEPVAIPTGNVSAKSPVRRRGGRRQVVMEETVAVAEDTKVQKKGQKKPAAAKVTGGRSGKHDEQQPAVEKTSVKTPSRARKRPPTSDDTVDAPVSKRQRQHAQESLVADQPMKTAAKRRGKSSEPAEPLAQPKQKKGTKKVSPSALKKSAGTEPDRMLDVVVNLSDSKVKKKNVSKPVAEKKVAVVSPPATRNKRARR